jgi:hypothetical protein
MGSHKYFSYERSVSTNSVKMRRRVFTFSVLTESSNSKFTPTSGGGGGEEGEKGEEGGETT